MSLTAAKPTGQLSLRRQRRVRDGAVIGDPTEAALLILAAKGGVQRDTATASLPRVAEIPFDSTHKFMATFHHEGAHIRELVKGAPDILLARCSHVATKHGLVVLDGVLVLQFGAVHWPPARLIFHTTALHPMDWALAIGVASSILFLEEARKLVSRLALRRHHRTDSSFEVSV